MSGGGAGWSAGSGDGNTRLPGYGCARDMPAPTSRASRVRSPVLMGVSRRWWVQFAEAVRGAASTSPGLPVWDEPVHFAEAAATGSGSPGGSILAVYTRFA